MPLIEFHNVSKTFTLAGGRRLLRHYLGNSLRPRKQDLFYALRDVSFAVAPGESVALIGPNGAGKSTLLSMVAGLVELGVGFHEELTGRENVRLNASLMGLSRRQTTEVFDAIIDFSGVEDFINEPLRAYSAGMKLRLAFAVAIHCDPDILLTDEVLVVGDQAFQAKCMDKINDFRRRGKTLLCVSHSTEMVRKFCDRGIWLDHGQIVMTGTATDVLKAYCAPAAAAQPL
jgi:ABC-type polysaccharide/polyol phosphate transport system ATPase subunit